MGWSNEMLQHPVGGAGWMLECCQQHSVHPKTLWRPKLASGWSVVEGVVPQSVRVRAELFNKRTLRVTLACWSRARCVQDKLE